MEKGLPKKKPIEGVQEIVLVVSGKGGVGKSTTSVNLATAMAQTKNVEVGLLDADVFGPSIPLMMKLNDSPLLNNDNKMIPLKNYGVKCMSMGFLVTEKSAVIWRGLMVMSALDKLMRHVDWSPTYCLFVDTPPGTGDTLLTLIQNLPISGVIMVTTPQKAAVQVTRRGATMLEKLGIPIIGLVSNMSSVQCPQCNSSIPVFGNEAKSLADELNIPLLAEIPVDSDISRGSDLGTPSIISSPNSIQANIYKKLADDVLTFFKKR